MPILGRSMATGLNEGQYDLKKRKLEKPKDAGTDKVGNTGRGQTM